MKHTLKMVKKWFFVLVVGGFLSSGFSELVFAAGYKIPEQSSNAIGLAAAYVANAHGPDSAYYNPANMVWSSDSAALETSLSYIHLPGVDFSGTYLSVPASTSSKREDVVLPNIHYISPSVGKARFGFSIVYPFGLSKRWDALPQRTFFKEFTLEVIELDLAVAFMVRENFSMGWGIRGLFSEGIIKGDGTATLAGLGTRTYARELKGDDFNSGYYLSLSYKPVRALTLSTLYRSKITPNLEGNATLSASGAGGGTFSGPASLEVVLPATWQVAAAYTHSRAVFEFVYERTYWSAYRSLDIEYGSALGSPVLSAVFDDAVVKNWENSDTYRLGFTYLYSQNFTWLLGLGYDESPIPNATLSFELPGADAIIYSTALKYRAGENTMWALGYLLSDKKDRDVSNASVNGTFKSRIHIVNASLTYYF